MSKKQQQQQKAKIIIITSCRDCPNQTVEETKKVEYNYCWTILKTIDDLDCFHEECPLDDVDIEEEEIEVEEE